MKSYHQLWHLYEYPVSQLGIFVIQKGMEKCGPFSVLSIPVIEYFKHLHCEPADITGNTDQTFSDLKTL